MKYLVLLYESEAAMEKLTPQEGEQLMKKWFKVTDDLKTAGVHLAGDGLKPVSTATTVRIRNGKTVTTDGPFAETKEQLGGFYLIDVPNLEHAISWAEKMPTSLGGSTEVRPVMEY